MTIEKFNEALTLIPKLQADLLRRAPVLIQGYIGSQMEFKSAPTNGVFERNTTKTLNIRGGNLFRSFTKGNGQNITEISNGALKYGSKVVYAAIHEYGGTINHPGSTKPQAWRNSEGKLVIRGRGTKPHPIKIPARPYFAPALKEFEKNGLPELLEEVFKPLVDAFK